MNDKTSQEHQASDRAADPVDFSALVGKEKLVHHEVLALLRLRTWEDQRWEDADEVGIGNRGDYLITEDGIRAEPITHEELSQLSVEEQRALLEFKEVARLDFPCTPAELVAWVERQAEFVLPDSFVEALRLKEPEYRAASISTVKKACEEWLSTLIKAGPPQKPRKEYQQEAMTKFKRLSSRGFLDAWKNAIARSGKDGKSWSSPGRKRKINHSGVSIRQLRR